MEEWSSHVARHSPAPSSHRTTCSHRISMSHARCVRPFQMRSLTSRFGYVVASTLLDHRKGIMRSNDGSVRDIGELAVETNWVRDRIECNLKPLAYLLRVANSEGHRNRQQRIGKVSPAKSFSLLSFFLRWSRQFHSVHP